MSSMGQLSLFLKWMNYEPSRHALVYAAVQRAYTPRIDKTHYPIFSAVHGHSSSFLRHISVCLPSNAASLFRCIKIPSPSRLSFVPSFPFLITWISSVWLNISQFRRVVLILHAFRTACLTNASKWNSSMTFFAGGSDQLLSFSMMIKVNRKEQTLSHFDISRQTY